MTVHALKSPKVASLRSKVSPEEWQARVDLAAAYRLVDLYGMSDLIANHISVRVPGEHDAFYKKLIDTMPLKNVTSRFSMERIKSTTAYPLGVETRNPKDGKKKG